MSPSAQYVGGEEHGTNGIVECADDAFNFAILG
jgi:hypothetical protein